MTDIGALPFGLWPTPVQAMGDQLWVKREDLSGFGFGGTKVRALAPIIADATASGARVLVTGGRRDSNWLALAAFASARVGLGFHAVVDQGDNEPNALQLIRRWGGILHVAASADRAEIAHEINCLAERLGGYPVPRAGACETGVDGYRRLASEILAQVPAPKMDIVVPVGSGGLAAGLLRGLADHLPSDDADSVRVCGVPVAKSAAQARTAIIGLAGSAVTERLDLLARCCSVRLAEQVAARAGVLLDPVFGAPAWSAYLGARALGRSAVLVASGGIPAYLDDASSDQDPGSG